MKEKILKVLSEYAEIFHIPIWIITTISLVMILGSVGILTSSVDLGNLTIGTVAAGLLFIGTLAVWGAYRIVFGTFSKYVEGKLTVNYKEDFLSCSPGFRIGIVTGSSLILLFIYAILCCAVV